jgi:hypothetical protein
MLDNLEVPLEDPNFFGFVPTTWDHPNGKLNKSPTGIATSK